ncbi:MAG: PTS sugar transporter subunit IIC [Deltaproteobacteria bacterium]|nr:PTS sugar transporter subunit IIC [Deltaproteobacteria bacterium]
MGQALIWAAAAFVAGGVLNLERRCLGQMALAQPLVLCAIAGLLSGQPEAGVWIGICLQLMAHGHARDADWPLAGSGAALALLYCPALDLRLGPGDPGALIAVVVPVAAALGAQLIERRLSRKDGAAIRLDPPWDADQPAEALERLMRGRLLRGVVLGGAETLAVGAISLLGVVAIGDWGGGGDGWRTLVQVSVPAVAAAVALGSLADYRLLALTGLGLAGTLAQAVVT